MRTLTGHDTAPRTVPSTDSVAGILCGAGHFNHPRWRHCRLCGSALLTRVAQHAQGPRPVVGMLLRDDGLRIAVSDRFLVVLRDSAQAPSCVPWHDRGRSLVRVRVYFSGWAPILEAESHGARLLRRGSAPMPLLPGTPIALHGGWSIHLGRGAFLYESLEFGPEPSLPEAIPTTRGRHRARRFRLPDPAIFPRRSTP